MKDRYPTNDAEISKAIAELRRRYQALPPQKQRQARERVKALLDAEEQRQQATQSYLKRNAARIYREG